MPSKIDLRPVPVRPRPTRRPRKPEIARFYNTEVLPKKRAAYLAEFGEEPDTDHLFEVKAEDLSIGREWPCPTSPTKYCVYEENSGESCLFCGDPEERK